MIRDFFEKNKNKGILLVSHGNCSDGFGAAWAVWKNLNEEYDIEYKFMLHNQKLDLKEVEVEVEVEGKAILFTDFVFDPPTMLNLSQTNPLLIIDHHIDAKNELEKFPNAYFDITQAASVLVWKDVSSEPVPPLLKFVEDRDLQKYKLPFNNEVLRVLSTVKKSFEEWDEFNDKLNNDIGEIIDNGRLLKKQYKKYLSDILRHARDITILGKKGKVVNASWEFASDAAEELAKDADFGMAWFAEKNGTIRTSWRSTPGSDLKVNWLAGLYGGGGHEHSAGAPITLQQLSTILKSEDPVLKNTRKLNKVGLKKY